MNGLLSKMTNISTNGTFDKLFHYVITTLHINQMMLFYSLEMRPNLTQLNLTFGEANLALGHETLN